MKNRPKREKNDEEWADEEYSDMELLERLESLREQMEELGIKTYQELLGRIDELNRLLDTREIL